MRKKTMHFNIIKLLISKGKIGKESTKEELDTILEEHLNKITFGKKISIFTKSRFCSYLYLSQFLFSRLFLQNTFLKRLPEKLSI